MLFLHAVLNSSSISWKLSKNNWHSSSQACLWGSYRYSRNIL